MWSCVTVLQTAMTIFMLLTCGNIIVAFRSMANFTDIIYHCAQLYNIMMQGPLGQIKVE